MIKKLPIPENEHLRLKALLSYHILDTAPEQPFDDLTALAAYICGTPVALISLIDTNRQWFKSRIGLEVTETPREVAFCAHAICKPDEVLIVPNALEDERFANNSLVTCHPNIRFYAGVPLVTADSFALGTLCTIDFVPKNITPAEIEALQALSRQVISQMELRMNLARLKENIIYRQQVENSLRNTNQKLNTLRHTQMQLIQSEKMSSLAQVVAGVAHEINNPVNFIEANFSHVRTYIQNLLDLLSLYQCHYPNSNLEIQQQAETIDLSFIKEDLPKILSSMQMGTQRIQQIVLSLRNFSRLDEADTKIVNIHEGIDSTLLILQHRFRNTKEHPEIEIIKHYGSIPLIECYASELNQVFMNIISNAIDAIEERVRKIYFSASPTFSAFDFQLYTPSIRIQTKISDSNNLLVRIADNGAGIPEAIQKRIFDPFFTSKSVGKGTGLGLSISYQIIVKKHNGSLKYRTKLGEGTEFWIEIPIKNINL